jgi:hypothetical protein
MERADQKRRPLTVMASSSSQVAAARGMGMGLTNPLAEWTSRVRSLEAGVRAWLAKQPTHVEAAVVTAVGAVQGAALGGLMGTLAPDGGAALPVPPPPPPGADPKVLASFKQAQVLTGPVPMRNHFALNITTSTIFALM